MSGRTSDRHAESIRQRVRNELRARGENVEFGLQRYAVERFLYRLGRSSHRKSFVLKGATLFAIWGTVYRPTRDIDLTGYGSSEVRDVIDAFREICNTPDEVESLVFDTEGITVDPIRDGTEYGGLRVRLRAWLGESDIPIQVDVGFGNAIVPEPEEIEFRTLLGDPPPRILAYPQEAIVAEKCHAMVILGERNSRFKDFYDIHALAGAFRFERSTLVTSVRATFDCRSTPVEDALPAALGTAFYANPGRAAQWRAYVSRNDLLEAPSDFVQVGERITTFLQPVWQDLRSDNTHAGDWPPGGPWR